MTDDNGTAGASARREYERRRARDEERLRTKWGRFGGIAVALSDERQSTRAWSVGAVGEEAVGARLDAITGDSVRVLHDRRIPGSRANIDHLVVTSGGIWVVDTKRYKSKRPTLRVEGGLFGPARKTLMVGGRNKTNLVQGVQWQMEQVRAVSEDVPVFGALCFVESDWPLFGGSFTIGGVEVLWPKRLVDRLRATPDAGVNVDVLAQHLAARFRA